MSAGPGLRAALRATLRPAPARKEPGGPNQTIEVGQIKLTKPAGSVRRQISVAFIFKPHLLLRPHLRNLISSLVSKRPTSLISFFRIPFRNTLRASREMSCFIINALVDSPP
jgi:hypothetical protein